MRNFYTANLQTRKIFSTLSVLFTLILTVPVFGQVVVPFNANGTFTVPAGITSIKVEAWGGGSGGSTGYGGGGGGAFAGNNTLTVIPGNNYAVTVGNGGAALNNGAASGFASLVIAAGANANNGGTVANSTGTIRFAGGNGANGTGNGGGGGGGSAGAGGNGSNGVNSGTNTGGAGGAGGIAGGGTAGANGGAGGNNGAGGVAGIVPGGGGGENGNGGAGSAAGAKGRVIVSYFLAPTITNFSPAAACAGSGSTITITGANFSNVSAVKFNGVNAASFIVVNTNTITAVLPAAASNGTISVTTTSGTATSAASFSITANGSISLGSGNANPTVCIGTAITNIVYNIAGTATGATLTGSLPAGVSGSFATGAFTITGTPTASGTFNYTVTTTGSACANPAVNGTITVNANATISLSSAAGSDAQVKCINNSISNITYAVGGSGTGIIVSGLPAGVTGNYAAGIYTISGTPTAAGTFNYSVTTTGPCVKPSLGGTITVTDNGSITLSSAAGTTTQAICLTNAITNITYNIGGNASGAAIISGALPAGVTGSFNAGVFTINGTPTAAGIYNFTVGTTGSACINPSLSATITVNENATISLSSAPGTDLQSLCASLPITNITYATAGFGTTGATVTGLPAGISGSYASGVFTISGSTAATGSFNYTVTTTGPCTNTSLSGTIVSNNNGTVTLSSAPGTNVQVVCLNNPVTTITYNIDPGATSAAITSGTLPAGLTGSYNAGVFTITGTAAATGVYNYTVGAIGSACANLSASGSITVNENATIILSSAAGTDGQTKCINTAIANITYSIAGYGTTGATVTGLPAGVTGSYASGIFTISGTPTVSGTFNYTVTTTGPCGTPAAFGGIIVDANSTIAISAGTANQTKCINTALTTVTYTIGGGATGATLTAGAFPAGVTGVLAGNVFTISGTPTLAGVFSYTVTTTGPCNNLSVSGVITVTDNATIALSSAAGTDGQTKCINTAITNITYNIGGGGTGATVTGLPAGVNAVYSAGICTISGTPSVAGTFNYTVTTTGPCIKPALGGTITVTPNASISRTSSVGSAAQTICINNGITPITYAIGGSGTGATATGLPAGVTGSFASGVYTISGTPTVTGTFNYTVSATGPCVNPAAAGSININDDATIALTSAAATTSQILCINTAIVNITYSIGGGGTGVTVTGLPAGVTGSYNSGTRVYTISGAPSVPGTFNYTVTTTGPCVKPALGGTITVTANATITRTSNLASTTQTVCINTPLANIVYSIAGSGTGATVTGLPTGVNGVYNAGVYTISGTPTQAGIFPYTVTTTGPCLNPSLGGTITVTADGTIALTSAAATTSQIKCINTAITSITYNINGSATGANTTGLPTGLTTNYNAGTHIYTISGSPTQAGTFNYTVTTTGPCVKPALSGTMTVTPNATISLSSAAGSNVQTICTGTAVSNISYTIGGSGTGATTTGLPAGVTGNFSSGVYTLSGAPTAAGTYNFIVTTTGPCVNPTASGTLTVNALPAGTLNATENSGTPNNNIICAGSSVTFTATSGFGSYIFKVNGSSLQSGVSNVFNSTTLTNGASVTVDVANGLNCGTTFGPIVITVNALPVATLSADRTAICPGDNVIFTATGGTSYTFKVNGSAVQSGSANTFNTTTLTNGNAVSVTVTNANGCSTTSSSIVMTVNALPTGTLSASSTSICTGDNITFTATAGYPNYNFKVNGISVQNGSLNTFSSTTLTNPSVVTADVTNAATCQATFGPLVITVNALPTGTLIATENSGTPNDNSICAGSNISFTATAGFNNYNFKVNGVSQQSGLSNIFNSTSLANNNVVTVVVTNGSNCTATFNSVLITVIPSPAGTLISSAASGCTGDNIDLTATPGFDNYNFKVNGSTVQNGSGNMYSSTSFANGDVVTVEVTNANLCVSTFNPVTIVINALPSGILVAVENSGSTANDGNICTGAAIVFTAPTGYTNYNFLLNAVSIQNGTSNTYTNAALANGDMVTVAITNANNCIALLNTITVSVSAYTTVQPITGPSDVCMDNTITLADLTPGGTWSSSDMSNAMIDAAGVVTAISPGTSVISYTLTNANGCISSVTILLTIHPLPFISPITGSTNVCINNTTQLSTTTTGGLWSSDNGSIATVSSTGLVTGIADGTAVISYTKTTASNCTRIRNFTITVNAPPVLNPITGNLNVCKGNTRILANDTDGGVWTSNNTAIATVNSSTGLVTGVLAGIATISYTVTDGNGCTATATANVNILALPVPTLTGPNPICPNSTGIYTTEPGQVSYTWTFTGGTLVSGGTTTDNTITIDWDQPGPKTINVNYTNADGCFGAASATVTTTSGIVPFLSGPTPVCLNSSGTYSTDPGQNNYTWTVVGGNITSGGTLTDNTAAITWITAGAGSVSINYSDVNGCTVLSSTTLPVTVRTLPTATLNGNNAVCQNSSSPVVTFTGANGQAPYTFAYTINGGTTQTITTVSGNAVTLAVPTAATGTVIYTLLSVADNNNCSQLQTGTATITINDLATASIAGNTTVCQNSSALVTFTGITGTAPFTFFYNIDGGLTQSVTSISGNSVTVSVATGTTGTFIYNLLSVSDINNCAQVQSGTATIVVNASPTATVSGTISVCQNATAPFITFTGANGIAPYTFTYTINNGTNLTVISTGNVATVSVPTTTSGTFIYTLVSVQESGANTCLQAQAGTATVTVSATSIGGVVGTGNTVCSGSNSGTLILTGNTGNVTSWEFSTNGGTTWTSIANTTTSLIYTNLTTTTIYHAIVQSSICTSAISGNATITVNQPSVGGIVTTSTTVCSGLNSGTLTLSGYTGTITRWEFSVNGGGTWSTIANTTSTQGYTNLTQTTLYRAVVSNGVCAAANSIAATITVTTLPTATVSGTITVCKNAASPVITFTGANGIAPYTFTYKINAGGNLTVVSVGNTATVTAPTATVGVFTYTLVSVTSAATCTQTQTGSAVITVTAPPAAFTITPASANICQGSVQPLSAAGATASNGTMTFTSGPVNLAIPEGNRTSSIPVIGIPAGAIINSMSVNFNITHGNDADLVLNLKAPNNNTLNLVNERGGTGDNFTNTTISSTSVNPINAGTAPFPNTYSADAATNVGTPNSNVTAFSSLYGTPNGTWVFDAEDVVDCHGGFFACLFGLGTYYTGTLNSWSITFNYTLPNSPVNAVWAPATGLYTDAGGITAYAGQNLATVYAKPLATTTYTATTTNAANCSTSQTVNVVVSPTPVVTITADYCAVAGKVRLTATSVPAATSYIWSNGATTASIDVDVAGSFDVTVFAGGSCPGTASLDVAQELVANGDFELGNTGFITPPLGGNQYIYQADITGNSELNPEGLYGIGPDAHTYHNSFWGHDHTTGAGNFMIINGFPNGNPQPIVWQQTVTVLPNTSYYFAAWGMSVNNSGPFAQLQFNVNGAQVGTVATLPAGVNNNTNNGWTRFYGTWTSGPSTTSAVISITDLQNAAGGNDFGLDDISFATLSTFITLESATGTNAQTLCVNTPLTSIVYSVGNGSPSGPTVTGLPAGVTSTYAGNLLTIAGTPTVAGVNTYTITTTGGCLPTSATGTITVQAQAIALSSGTAVTTVCTNAPVNIGYTLSGTATGATVTGLPAGISGSVSGTAYTISGTTALTGSYPYTITTTGTCAAASISGTITIQSQTITLNTANNNQAVCINAPIANIQYTVGGTGTGVSVTGLPAGVNFSYNSGIVFITGTPVASGTFNYTVNSTGTCAAATAGGTIIVNPAATLVLTSSTGTNTQSVCKSVAITAITYTVNGGTGASVIGLPSGVSGSYSAGNFTISGTPAVNGIFNYTITTTGGCGTGTATGTITVQSQLITLSSGSASPTLCVNTVMTNIVYTLSGTATGATISGLPAGVGFTITGSTVTISGTPTATGTFAYVVTTTGSCAATTANGTITVQPGANGGTVASVTICSGGSGTLTVTGQSGTIVRWEFTTDGGATWTTIANSTITQSYNNITDPTGYRAVVNNGCANANSTIAMIAIHNYWTGATSIDWNTASNWGDNVVPTLFCADVHIKGGKPNQPTLGTGSAQVENIHVYPGAILTIDNATLKVSGVVDNTGIIIAATATMELNSSATQTLAVNTFQNNALRSLIISNSSAQGVVLGGPLDIYRSLTYTGTGRKFNTGGFLTLKSTADETAWLGDLTGNVITGDATVERYIATGIGAAPNHGKSWQLLAVPTTGQTIKQAWQEGAVVTNGNPKPGFGTMLTSNVANAATQPNPGFDVFTAPGPSIKNYNYVTNSYDGPSSTNNPIYNQKGYFILVRGDRSVIAFNQPANQTVLRTKGSLFTPSNPPAITTVQAGKFESVGNPYASALDVRNIAKTGGVDEFFYVWDPRLGGGNNLGAFQTLFKVGANYYAMPGGGSYGAGVNNFIQSGQAFLVQATASTGTVGFSENAKANGSALLFRDNQSNAAVLQAAIKTNLYGIAADGTAALADGTLNLFADNYSNNIDGLDAKKPANTGENLSVKTNDKLLAIERRHTVITTDTIFLNLAGVRLQSYRFEFDASGLGNNGLEGFLQDNYLQEITPLDLNGTTSVSFNIANVPGSYAPDRFRIVFKRLRIVPVTFTSIKAFQQAKNINVEWKTENEINIKQYEVEKSLNGAQFTTLAVKSPAANNGNAANYEAIDEHPENGYNYYRVRSVDVDGKTQYTNVVKILIEAPKPDITIFPNPITNGIVNLQLINQPAGEYAIKLYNNAGQVLLSRNVNHADGSSTEKLNWDYNLAHGTYLLEVIKPGGSKKVIKVLY